MTSQVAKVVLTSVFVVAVTSIFAMSIEIGRDINFPQSFDPQKVKAIRKVIRDEGFTFVSGIVSIWPPDIDTRLSFDGGARSLNKFLADLKSVPGMNLEIILYNGRNDELRRDSPWQLDFSQSRPNELVVYVNESSAKLDLDKVTIPERFKVTHSRPQTGYRQ